MDLSYALDHKPGEVVQLKYAEHDPLENKVHREGLAGGVEQKLEDILDKIDNIEKEGARRTATTCTIFVGIDTRPRTWCVARRRRSRDDR